MHSIKMITYRALIVMGLCMFPLHNAASLLPTTAAFRGPPNNNYLPPVYPQPTTYHRQGEKIVTLSEQNTGKTEIGRSRPATMPAGYQTQNSYAPPPSGAAAFKYSSPHPAQSIPLPSLLPRSILNEFTPPRPPMMASTVSDRPMLMVEEPSTMVFATQANEWVAQLASTLLTDHSNGGSSTNSRGESIAPNSVAAALPALDHQLEGTGAAPNRTDVVIVKSQKNAYLIPSPLATVRDATDVRSLYQMRDHLEKAFTINQFIFIIKPEKINFLNKLV